MQAKLQQSSFHQQQEELERLRKAIGQKLTYIYITELGSRSTTATVDFIPHMHRHDGQ